jgi:hypothetical protein
MAEEKIDDFALMLSGEDPTKHPTVGYPLIEINERSSDKNET